MGIIAPGVPRLMYEPFTQAIENFQPHPEHTVTLEVYRQRLETCDDCHGREELACNVNARCRKCSIVSRAQRKNPTDSDGQEINLCPWGRWG